MTGHAQGKLDIVRFIQLIKIIIAELFKMICLLASAYAMKVNKRSNNVNIFEQDH